MRHTTTSRSGRPSAAVLAAALTVGMLATAGPAAAAVCGIPGSGTAGGPYLVATEAHLRLVGVGDCALDADYRQTADITMSAAFTPIGTFTGVYDGGGRSIAGLEISLPTTSHVGLFSYVAGVGAEVRDLTLVAPAVVGRNNVGAVVGSLLDGAAVDAIRVEGGSVQGEYFVGGVAGEAGHQNTASYDAATPAVPVRFTDVRTSADVSSIPGFGGVGGLLGLGYRGIVVTDVVATGDVDGPSQVGGLIGVLESIDRPIAVTRASASGAVTSTDFGSGGLIGSVDNRDGATLIIEEVRATGAVTSIGTDTGGLVGYAFVRSPGTIRITDAVATGPVSGTSAVGGLIGSGGVTSMPATFELLRARAEGDVTVTGSSRTAVGGVVGSLNGGTVAEVFAIGDVDAGDGTRVGGLVGSIGYDAFGSLFSSELRDVHAAGAVFGGDHVGGLVGFVVHDSTITRALARGAVTATGVGASAGGLVATVDTGKTLTQSGNVWDTVTTAQPASVGDGIAADVAGFATADLKLLATFTGRGWGIVSGWAAADRSATPPSVWSLCALANDGYASLRWTGTSASANDCVEPRVASAPAPSTVSLACAPDPVLTGRTVTCTVTSAESDFDFMWATGEGASPTGGVVTTDADGRGTFTFVAGRSALGSIGVELVAWGVRSGVTVTAVPTSIPAGGGPSVPVRSVTLSLLVVLLAGLLGAARLSSS